MAVVLFWLFFFITFLVVCRPTTLKFVPPVKYNNFFIGRWNREETCEIRKFDKAIWESNFDTMGYVSMGRWKYRKQNFSVSTEDIASHISIIQTGWLLQKQLMAQEFTTVFNQMVKQILSYIPCQLMRYLLLKIFMQAMGYL